MGYFVSILPIGHLTISSLELQDSYTPQERPCRSEIQTRGWTCKQHVGYEENSRCSSVEFRRCRHRIQHSIKRLGIPPPLAGRGDRGSLGLPIIPNPSLRNLP